MANLVVAWTAPLVGVTIGQVLVLVAPATGASPLPPGASPAGVAIVGDNAGYMYCFDAATGVVLWTRFLAVAYGGPLATGVDGVMGTSVADVAAGVVYAVAAGGLYKLRLVDGTDAWTTPTIFDSSILNAESALTLVGGRVIVQLCAQAGDAPNVNGSVIAVSTTTGAITASFFPAATVNESAYGPSWGGGLWGPAGAVSAPDGNPSHTSPFIWTAVGNVGTTNQTPGHGDQAGNQYGGEFRRAAARRERLCKRSCVVADSS